MGISFTIKCARCGEGVACMNPVDARNATEHGFTRGKCRRKDREHQPDQRGSTNGKPS